MNFFPLLWFLHYSIFFLHLHLLNPILILQLRPKRSCSYRWKSKRLGLFPTALPDGFHDHARLPGPVPSHLCLCDGATLSVLPCCWCRGYKPWEWGLLWHSVPTWWPLPSSKTQTPSKYSPQLLICWQQRTSRDPTTPSPNSFTVQTLREEKW